MSLFVITVIADGVSKDPSPDSTQSVQVRNKLECRRLPVPSGLVVKVVNRSKFINHCNTVVVLYIKKL